MKLIFISDLHLSQDTPTENQKFFTLLKSWRGQIDGLYIMGDFFDYWLGDDDDNQFIRDIKFSLQEFSKLTPIYFRGGNHDFAVGKKFAKECGIKLIPDMTTIQVNGQTILLSHGDTFCTLDIGYQRMKRIFQNPLSVFILRRIPIKYRRKLKEAIEYKSHNKPHVNPDYIYQVVDRTVIKYAKKHAAKIVIHGHTHRPGSYVIKTDENMQIKRYEIPDWQDHEAGGYIILDDEQITVVMPN